MALTVADVMDILERWAPAALAYDWDRTGLNIGAPDAPLSSALTCLSITRPAFDQARKAGAELIVSHHPVLWEPLKTLRTDAANTRLCLDIANAGMAALSLHTNLDVAPNGLNHLLAEKLGVEECTPLLAAPQAKQVKLVVFVPNTHLAVLREAVSQAGAGVIGDYTHCTFSTPGTGTFLPGAGTNPFSGEKGQVNEEAERRFEVLVAEARLGQVLAAMREAHPYEEVAYDLYELNNTDPDVGLGLRGCLPKPVALADFAAHVRKALGVKHVRFAGQARRKVRTVAMLGGGGGGDAGKIPDDIDVYVTGDVKYHDALAAVERGMAVIDATHEGTERFVAQALSDYLRKACPDLTVRAYQEPEVFRVVTQ
ncbi:MAG: Nif3-like dinuclear metal center hexameric protein [Candidatus Hydrogenedentota bacterium]